MAGVKMTVSLRGLCMNLRRGIREGAHVGGELFLLDELVRHLAMVQENHSRVGEFFETWVSVEPIGEDLPMCALDLMGPSAAADLVERMTPDAVEEMHEAIIERKNREYRARPA